MVDFRHPELKEFIKKVESDQQAAAIDRIKEEQAAALSAQLELQQEDNRPDWVKDSEYLMSFNNQDEINVVDFVDILRKMREIGNAISNRADAFANLIRPTEPITVEGKTYTPEQVSCLIKKAFHRPPTTDLGDLASQDKTAVEILKKIDDVKSKYIFNFWPGLLYLLLRIVLKFIVTVAMKPICQVLALVPFVKLQTAFDNMIYGATGISPCGGTFNLEDEMRSKPALKALSGQDVGFDEMMDFSDSKYETVPDDCSDAAMSNLTAQKQADALEELSRILAAENTVGSHSMEDTLKYRDSMYGKGTKTRGTDIKTSSLTYTELTIAERIKADATVYVGGIDRLEHKLTTTDGNIPDTKVSRAVYDGVMTITNMFQAWDNTLSAFIHENKFNKFSTFSQQSWLCCAIRILFAMLVHRYSRDIPADTKKKIMDFTTKGIGYTLSMDAKAALKNSIDSDELELIVTMMDMVLSRLANGDVSFSAKITNIKDWLNATGMNIKDEFINMLIEMLTMTMSLGIDRLENWIKSVFHQGLDNINDEAEEVLQSAIEVCEPIKTMLGMMNCWLNDKKLWMFGLLADKWRKNNTQAMELEAMFNLKVNHKNMNFFRNLINLVLHMDDRIIAICGVSDVMSDKAAEAALESIMNDLNPADPHGTAGAHASGDNTSGGTRLIPPPVLDPNAQFGPEPDFINSRLFRTNRHGGNTYTVDTSPLYRTQPVGSVGNPQNLDKPEINTPILNCAQSASHIIEKIAEARTNLTKDIFN